MKRKDFWKGFGVALALIVVLNLAWKPICRAIPWHVLPFEISMSKDAKVDMIQSYLDKYYVEDIDQGKLEDTLFAGMLDGVGDKYTYYMPKENLLEHSVTQIEIFDTLFAFFAGLMIIPSVIAFNGGDPSQVNSGPSLMFISLPMVFDSMKFGTVIGAVLLAFDVTEQAFAERNRREFTANVSHELKTPLQSIMGSAELIENGLVKQEDMPRFVGHIRTEAARLVTLIEDIIRLSQLDEGGELPFEPVDLKKLAEEASASLASAAAEKQVTIRVHGDDRQITTVRRLASEIIYNLCDNAVKYNREGGSVDVTIDGAAHGAVVTVQDTGIGIPPEHQSRVFERFYRVDKSHSRQSGGTGLGLSIVKHAVQYLGGRIELESQPGKGTTMRVHFPDGNV